MKKGVVLAIVIGIMFVISALALAALYLTTQQSRISEHKIRRMRVFYAAKGVAVHALEGLRKGTITSGSDLTDPVRVGNGATGYPSGGLHTKIKVGTLGAVLPGVCEVEATASYGPIS